MNRLIATAIVGLLAAPALAEGDAAKGEKTFNKCKACHSIISDSGETIVKGGKTGPNLFGVIGRTAGTYEDFRYGDDIVAVGEAGLVWDEKAFNHYVEDPRGFLRETLDDKGAIYKFQAIIDGRLIVGEVQDKDQVSHRSCNKMKLVSLSALVGRCLAGSGRGRVWLDCAVCYKSGHVFFMPSAFVLQSDIYAANLGLEW